MAEKTPNWKKDIVIKYHLIGYSVLCRDYIKCNDSNCRDRESFACCYIDGES